VTEKRAQIDAVTRYLPALLRMLPGLSDRRKEYLSLYENVRNVAFTAHHADRYTQNSASAAPDLDRLRGELYHYPVTDPAPTGP
jgi:heptaprenyl diphosphate synthase